MTERYDDRTALIILAAILLVPLLVCCVIVLGDAGVKNWLLFDFFKILAINAILVAGATVFFMRREKVTDQS